MNKKQELKLTHLNYLKRCLEEAQEERQEINDNILWLKEQLAEAEKPELGHGDFGIVPKGGWKRIRLFRNAEPDRGENRDYNPYGICNTEDFISFGNIFDLIKDWGKEFDRATIEVDYHKRKIVIEKSKPTEGIFMATAGEIGVHLAISEAEEIWRKLGHAIIELKRKKQGADNIQTQEK